MAKGKGSKSKKTTKKKESKLDAALGPDLPDEAVQKLEKIRGKLDKFKDQVLKKFEDYVVGISLAGGSKEIPTT